MGARREPWTVLAVLGVSGSGKSTLARHLSLESGSTWLQTDDLRIAFHAADVTFNRGTPYPLHFDRTPVSDFLEESPVVLRDHMIAVAQAMQPAVQVVIENHVMLDQPVIVEGDSIHPDLFLQPVMQEYAQRGELVACCLRAESEDQLRGIMVTRGRHDGLTDAQIASLARFQWMYGLWLVERCIANGVPVIDMEPRSTLPPRVLDRIRSHWIG